MKKGVIGFVGAVFVFVVVLALGAGGLALVGKVASGVQDIQVSRAQAEIAKQERLQVEAEMAPELIEEEWQGANQHLLLVTQSDLNRMMVQGYMRLALADLNRNERQQAFTYVALTLILCFLVGLVWWQAAKRAVGQ